MWIICLSGYPGYSDTTSKAYQTFNEENGFRLDISFRSSPRPSGGSDHTPFARKDIPIIYFIAGFPPEYHQPDDHIELVN